MELGPLSASLPPSLVTWGPGLLCEACPPPVEGGPWPGPCPRQVSWASRELSWDVPFISSEDAAVKGRLVECLETVLNKAQEPPKSKKVQHSNAKNAILFETISLIIHYDRCPPGVGGGGEPGSQVLGKWVWEL